MKYLKLALVVGVMLSSGVTARGEGSNLVPKPVREVPGEGSVSINPQMVIVATGQAADLAGYLNEYMAPAVGKTLPVVDKAPAANFILLSIDPAMGLPAEGYRVDVAPSSVTLAGVDRAGLFYAIQTLLQLMPSTVYSKEPGQMPVVACTSIEDYPAFPYRSIMLDVARTFTGKDGVIRLIDKLSHHKINHFHWHLADDEGWRVEIKSYPDLARRGGFRGSDLPVKAIYGSWDARYGGYYTQDEIREVVEYARFRNIEIIPEIDLPGHSRAAARIYPGILCGGKVDSTAAGYDFRNVWCVSKESNYAMLDAVIGEICALFPSKVIHIGGDEVDPGQWEACPDCARLVKKGSGKALDQITDHFMARMERILNKYGRTMAVWDEAAESGKLSKGSRVYGWQDVGKSLKAAANGYPTVVMPSQYFYIDMIQSPTDMGLNWAWMVSTERLYSFGMNRMGFKSGQTSNVIGFESALWCEAALSSPPWYVEYQMFPRACALAEVGWCSEESREWNDFYGRLTSGHLARLAAMKIKYRMFSPEAIYGNGTVEVKVPFAGAEVRYTTDGSEPQITSPLAPDRITGDMMNLRFRAFYLGNGGESVQPVVPVRLKSGASGTKIFEIPLDGLIDADGYWNVRFIPSDNTVTLRSMIIEAGDVKRTVVASATRLRPERYESFLADAVSRKGVLKVEIKNSGTMPVDVKVEMWRSPYVQPKVTFTSSLPPVRHSRLSYAADYRMGSWFVTYTTPRKKDWFLYTFERPVKCSSMEVVTGFGFLQRNIITRGCVELSYDGNTYTPAGTFSMGRCTVHPTAPVMAVRVRPTVDGNGEEYVILHDLHIKP